jgi:hypothetical protein
MGKERNPYLPKTHDIKCKKGWTPTLLIKAKINPYLPKKNELEQERRVGRLES